MFQIVECNTYMKRIKDGKYIRHSEQYSDVYYYVDENAEEKERKVEPEECGSEGDEKGSAVYSPGHHPWIPEIWSRLQKGREQPV